MRLEIRERGSKKLISDKLCTASFEGHLPEKGDIIHIKPGKCEEPYKETGYKAYVMHREFVDYNTCILIVYSEK